MTITQNCVIILTCKSRKDTNMTLKDFIKTNKSELVNAINAVVYRHDGRGGRGTIPSPAPTYPITEIREWIMNDEPLYRWARSEGVRI